MADTNCTLTFLNDREGEYTDDREFFGKKVAGNIGGDQLGRDTVSLLNEWVQKHSQQCHRNELRLLGFHLYRIAFETDSGLQGGPSDFPLKRAFEGTHANFIKTWFSDSTKRMRLKLVFEKGAGKLASLPWEFLCMPNGEDGIFLAGRAELILTRFVPEEPWASKLLPYNGDETLRILIVKSEPREEAEIYSGKLVEEIKKLKSAHIDVEEFEGRPTLQRLRERISGSDEEDGYRPHIVHFMGHGRAGELALLKDETQLQAEESDAAMRRERGEKVPPVPEAHWVDMNSVKSLFAHKPRVVFLHACEGAATDSLKSFSSTARELAYTQIPAVIAMQYPIGNAEAELFAKTFYRQLRQGMDVDEAVTAARRQLGEPPGRNVWNDRSFGTPVIYLQNERPIIQPPPKSLIRQSSSGEESMAAGTSGRVECPNGKCNALVRPGSSFCTSCMTPIMQCPVCKVMMMRDRGICENAHRLDSAESSQPTANEPKGFEPTPQRKRMII